jgi:hypothetical protein
MSAMQPRHLTLNETKGGLKAEFGQFETSAGAVLKDSVGRSLVNDYVHPMFLVFEVEKSAASGRMKG